MFLLFYLFNYLLTYLLFWRNILEVLDEASVSRKFSKIIWNFCKNSREGIDKKHLKSYFKQGVPQLYDSLLYH